MAHSHRSGPAEPCWTSSFQHASRTPFLLCLWQWKQPYCQGTQKSPLTSQQQGESCSWFPKHEKVGALVSHPLTSGPSVSSRPILGTLYLPLYFQKPRVAKELKWQEVHYKLSMSPPWFLLLNKFASLNDTQCNLKIILLCFYYIFHDKGQLALMWRSENPGFGWGWECVIWTEFLCILEYGLQMWGCTLWPHGVLSVASEIKEKQRRSDGWHNCDTYEG